MNQLLHPNALLGKLDLGLEYLNQAARLHLKIPISLVGAKTVLTALQNTKGIGGALLQSKAPYPPLSL